MNCPKCEGYYLKPQKLDNGLMALSCDNCRGTLLSIVQFIQWRATQKISDNIVNAICEIDETSQLLYCPKCSGFMTKYRISNHTHNRLDLCYRCYEVWIDSGEWQLLRQLDLQQQLDDIFSDRWQNNLVVNIIDEKIEKRVKNLFGDEFSKISAFKVWLDSYEKKNVVIEYLKKRKSK